MTLGIKTRSIIVNHVQMSVVKLSVIVLSVLAPSFDCSRTFS
jgi:hypothetical protein